MNLPDRATIATEIRVIMAKKNVSATDLAEALGVTRTTMSAIRNGNASYELLKRTIDTLDKWEA